MGVRNQKDLYEKKSLCPPVTLQWFSIQILVILQVFKLQKIFAFRCKGLEISILPNIVLLFLSPIVICQQLLLVVIDNRKGFWRAKLPRFHTKPSNFCNIKIVIKSQPYTALV